MAQTKIDSNLGGFYLWPPSWIIDRPKQDGSLTKCAYEFTFDCEVRVQASTYGYFLCDFSKTQKGRIDTYKDIEEKLTFRTRFLNLILVSLYTAHYRLEKTSVEKHYVDIDTYFSARSMDLNPYNASSSIQQNCIFEASLQRQKGFPQILNVYSKEVLTEAFRLANDACKHSISESSLFADLILHAFDLHERNHFETSHTVSWTITERCINALWNNYINEQSKKQPNDQPLVNSERRQKLTGRDFSASVVSEILSLAGDIESDIYTKLNKARKDRNDWLHKLKEMDKKSSAISLNLAAEMLRKTRLLDVEFTIQVVKPLLINLNA